MNAACKQTIKSLMVLVVVHVIQAPISAELNWDLRSTAYTPPRKDGHCLVYDSVNMVSVMFAGYASDASGPPLYLYDGIDWYQIQPSGDWPSPRSDFGMAYDAERNVVVVFGGFQGGPDYLGDTWEWDGEQWEEKHPVESPSDRAGLSMAFFSLSHTVVLFGGYSEGEDHEFVNDQWEWNGFEWSLLTNETGPSPRASSSMSSDIHRDRIVIYGGTENGYSSLDDTWEWDGNSWSEIVTEHTPGGKHQHSLVYDSNREVTVLFGGPLFRDSQSYETWEYDGSDWLLITPAHHPSERGLTGMCFDSARNRVVLYGGNTWTGYSNETWEYYDMPPTPTPTVTPTITPTPTEIPTPPGGIRVDLVLPEGTVHAGEPFYLDALLINANSFTMTDIPLFVILEAGGCFWYHPGWTMDPAWEIRNLTPGAETLTVIDPFTWPGNAGNGAARFWGAVTDPEMSRILGQYDVKDFSWE